MLCQSVCAFLEYSLKQVFLRSSGFFFLFEESILYYLTSQKGNICFFIFVYEFTTTDNRILQSLWWFRSKGGFFLFPFFYVLFLYLLCFWFCSCWIDMHMCCRQSSGLLACTHMWCIYQQDPPWDLHAFLQLKLLSFKNRAYWHVSLQTNKRKKKQPQIQHFLREECSKAMLISGREVCFCDCFSLPVSLQEES